MNRELDPLIEKARRDPAAVEERIARLTKTRQALAASVSAIGYQIRHLRSKLSEEPERAIKDHAIIRYLERVQDIDVAAVRTEIRQLCDAAEPFASCDGMWHTNGLVIITNDDGDVVTVLGEDQANNYIGRRLQNGERATKED